MQGFSFNWTCPSIRFVSFLIVTLPVSRFYSNKEESISMETMPACRLTSVVKDAGPCEI